MSDGFARDVARVAVAQTCQSLGFTAGTSSALDALVDIFRRYVEEVGHRAHGYAEHAGRTEGNLVDVILALDSLGVSLQDVIEFCNNAEEAPFAKSDVPLDFPVKTAPKPVPQLTDEVEAHPASVPAFLPPFPPKHTYRETAVVEEFKPDVKEVRKQKAKGKRQVESSLNQLAAKFTTRSVYNYDVTAVATNKTEEKNILSNPWLQRPLPAGSQVKPSATPIPSQLVSRAVPFSVTEATEGGEQRQLKTRLDIDEGEKAKKKQKVEKILSGELQPEEPDDKASTVGGDAEQEESLQGGDSPVSSEEEQVDDEQSNATSMND